MFPMRQVLRFLFRHRWLPAAVWIGAILSVSSLPKLNIGPPLFPGCDKIAHLIEYFVLGVSLRFWAMGRGISGHGPWVILGGVVFGAADELHQRFIPGRQMSLDDFVADAVGFTLGYLLGHRLILRRLFARAREDAPTAGSELSA